MAVMGSTSHLLERIMTKKLAVLALALAFLPIHVHAQNKPTLLVQPFTVASTVPWPYDMHQLQLETAAELKVKDGDHFEVVTDPPSAPAHLYKLQGEVLEWHAGNRATRMFVGMGSGRETAKIHYWLIDEDGKKVFDHTDTIRADFWGNEYAGSVGELAHPFADKIAARLQDAKAKIG
jgi:Domain of unknown function (DUF4410)